MDYIKAKDCIDKGHYRVNARNYSHGVYVAKYNGFFGIRNKWGATYLDMEYHWDTGEPHGTVKPIELIGTAPEYVDTDPKWGEKANLFKWLEDNKPGEKDD